MNTIRHRIEEILKKLAPKAEESYHLVGSEPFYAIKESDLPELTNQIISTILESLPEIDITPSGIYKVTNGNPPDNYEKGIIAGYGAAINDIREALGEE